MKRLVAGAACVAALLSADVPAAGALIPSETVTPGDTIFRPAGRTAVAALGIAFPGGPERDPAGREGAAWIIAQSMRLELARRLGTDPSHVTLEMESAHTALVVQVADGDSDRALDVLRHVVLEDALPRTTVEDVRVRALDQLRFQAGSPILAYRLELARFLHGLDSSWNHGPLGSTESVSALDPGELTGLRQRIFPVEEAHWVVVRGPRMAEPGPPIPVDSSAELQVGADTPVQAEPGPLVPVERSPWQPQWTAADRLVITREITNSWVAVAYPLDPALPGAHREFLTRVLREALNPVPPDPGLFDGRAWIEESASGPLLILEATVFPADALRWEARILDAMEGAAAEPPLGAFYSFMARRQRTAHALREADPGALAHWLLRNGSGAVDTQVPTRAELGQAAAGLGAPRILIYGPDLAQDGTR